MKKLQAIIYSEWRRLKVSLIIASVVSVLSLIIVPFTRGENDFATICVGIGMGLTAIWVILMFESIGTDHEQAAFSSGMPVHPGLVFATRIILRTLIAGTICVIILSIPVIKNEIWSIQLGNFWYSILIYLAGILTVSSTGSKSRFLFVILVALPFIIFLIPSWGVWTGYGGLLLQFWLPDSIQYFILMAAMSCHLWIRRARNKRIIPAIVVWALIMIVLPWVEYITARTYWGIQYDRAVVRADQAGIRVFSEETVAIFQKGKKHQSSRNSYRRFMRHLAHNRQEPSFEEKMKNVFKEYNLQPGDVALRSCSLPLPDLMFPYLPDEEFLERLSRNMMFRDFEFLYEYHFPKNFLLTPERCRLLADFLKSYRDIRPPNKYNISELELGGSYGTESLLENIFEFFIAPSYNKNKTIALRHLIEEQQKWQENKEKGQYLNYFARYSVKLELYITYLELQARILEVGLKEFPDKLPSDLARENLEYLKTASYIVLKDTRYDYYIQIYNPRENR